MHMCLMIYWMHTAYERCSSSCKLVIQLVNLGVMAAIVLGAREQHFLSFVLLSS